MENRKKNLLLNKTNNDDNTNEKQRRRNRRVFWCSLVGIFVATQCFVHYLLLRKTQNSSMAMTEADLPWTAQKSSRQRPSSVPHVSLVILTYNQFDLFSLLLLSILQQKGRHNFEILIADSGCKPETKKVINLYLDDPIFNLDGIPYKYLEACDNPGYAIGNNRAVNELASESSKWLLFLNDDITMQGDNFLENMMKTVESHPKEAAGSGCVMKNSDGSKLIESGSILFQGATAYGFGRDRTDFDAPELSYPRPVDYVSGACLLVAKKVFTDYGGFDSATFPSYYEDTDLQTHIQHDLGKQIWLSPKSIAHHAEHASFGSSTATQLMDTSRHRFVGKWNHKLVDHLPSPFGTLNSYDTDVVLLRAADLRARDPKKANILWFDTLIPNRSKGGGYPRAFDNIQILMELGHRVTVAPLLGNAQEDWCTEECLDKLRSLGVEVATTDKWEAFVESRHGFYDVLIVSRPPTLKLSYTKWHHYLKRNPVAIVYDSEALVYRRDQHRLNLYLDGIDFPSIAETVGNNTPIWAWTELALTGHLRITEEQLIKKSDIVITVSEEEAQIAKKTIPNVTNIEVIGHVMEPRVFTDAAKDVPFRDRKGILFFAAFGKSMYYNGDAIWYFLKETYPKILQETPIPLTIAGQDIPSELRNFTRDNSLDKHVTFRESVKDISSLYDSHRVLIAPHLYGAGIQFKLSESLAMGIVTVMSKLSADAFGIMPEDNVTCIGADPKAFARCVISLYRNESAWIEMRQKGFEFIKKTHSKDSVKKTWTKIIGDAIAIQKELKAVWQPKEEAWCLEGDRTYKKKYPDVEKAVRAGAFKNAFAHYQARGKREGRIYTCDYAPGYHKFFLEQELWRPKPKRKCAIGERMYLHQHEGVRNSVAMEIFSSGFEHWQKNGYLEGKDYYCNYDLKKLVPQEHQAEVR